MDQEIESDEEQTDLSESNEAQIESYERGAVNMKKFGKRSKKHIDSDDEEEAYETSSKSRSLRKVLAKKN